MGRGGGQQGGSRWSAAAASSAVAAAVVAAYLSDHCSRKDSRETGDDGCARRSYILESDVSVEERKQGNWPWRWSETVGF